MKIIIEKNGDAKSMAKLKDVKDFVAILANIYPGQIEMREVIQIETSNRALYNL